MSLNVALATCGAITGVASSMALAFGTLAEQYPENWLWFILGALSVGVSTGAGMFAAALRPKEPPVIGR